MCDDLVSLLYANRHTPYFALTRTMMGPASNTHGSVRTTWDEDEEEATRTFEMYAAQYAIIRRSIREWMLHGFAQLKAQRAQSLVAPPPPVVPAKPLAPIASSVVAPSAAPILRLGNILYVYNDIDEKIAVAHSLLLRDWQRAIAKEGGHNLQIVACKKAGETLPLAAALFVFMVGESPVRMPDIEVEMHMKPWKDGPITHTHTHPTHTTNKKGNLLHDA